MRFKRTIHVTQPLNARVTNVHMFISCFHFVINISLLLKVLILLQI
jgi:hypothetical protein